MSKLWAICDDRAEDVSESRVDIHKCEPVKIDVTEQVRQWRNGGPRGFLKENKPQMPSHVEDTRGAYLQHLENHKTGGGRWR